MKNLAIIPARMGSKGLPKKNIKKLCGKPLIHWSIAQALQAKCVSKVIVSTDSEDIAEVALKSGAEVPFLRPDYLSDDLATTESVILHAIEHFEKLATDFDLITLLQPTSPIRKKNSIDQAYQEFITNNADSLLSVVASPHFIWEENGQEIISYYDYQNRPRRQDITTNKFFLENGSIYIFKVKMFKKYLNRLFGKISIFEMTNEELPEIDTYHDWLIVKQIMEQMIANDSL